MLDLFVVVSINRILRRNSWALERLQPYAGRTARFECPPLSAMLTVLENGEVCAAAAGAQPDVAFRLTPGVMLRVLARDEAVWKEMDVAGDTEFATAINHVWRNLRFDIEEDLAALFGDIAAHRMAETARALDMWRARSLDHLARSFAEYWTEEQPLIARAHEVEQFNRDVDRLRDDTARLEKRIELLLSR